MGRDHALTIHVCMGRDLLVLPDGMNHCDPLDWSGGGGGGNES